MQHCIFSRSAALLSCCCMHSRTASMTSNSDFMLCKQQQNVSKPTGVKTTQLAMAKAGVYQVNIELQAVRYLSRLSWGPKGSTLGAGSSGCPVQPFCSVSCQSTCSQCIHSIIDMMSRQTCCFFAEDIQPVRSPTLQLSA